jgi:hypothetical protein
MIASLSDMASFLFVIERLKSFFSPKWISINLISSFSYETHGKNAWRHRATIQNSKVTSTSLQKNEVNLSKATSLLESSCSTSPARL